jgi:hypothetical protein
MQVARQGTAAGQHYNQRTINFLNNLLAGKMDRKEVCTHRTRASHTPSHTHTPHTSRRVSFHVCGRRWVDGMQVSSLLPDLMQHAERLLKTKYLVKVPSKEEVATQQQQQAANTQANVLHAYDTTRHSPTAHAHHTTLVHRTHTHAHTHDTRDRRAC